jgi:hypothetical protein
MNEHPKVLWTVTHLSLAMRVEVLIEDQDCSITI